MLRALRKIVVLALSLIGAATVVHFFVFGGSSSTKEPKPDALQSLPSPSGKYEAQLLTWAGGGGLSPYCNQAVLVIPASLSNGHAEQDKRYEVYSGECGSFGDHSFSPKLAWRSDNVLNVSFSINSTAALPASVKLKKDDASGQVKIEFEAKE